MKNSKNKRRDFLMNVCPTVAMAFLGITVLESCSSGDDDVDIGGGFRIWKWWRWKYWD